MKLRTPTFLYFFVMAICLTVAAPFISQKNFAAYAQGNRISGYVTGINRQPLGELNVELLDEYSRMIARARTNGSGYYQFAGMSAGRFTIRVYTFGTYYEEQEGTVEIVNVVSGNGSGGTHVGGYSDELRDFTMKLRQGISPASVALFVQEVPPEAKKLYDNAMADLEGKRQTDAMGELRAAIEIFPKYYAALERLGTEYVRLGSPEAYQAAEILLGLAVGINPRGYKSWYGLAYSRYSLGKLDEALTAIQKAVELNGYLADAVFLSGVLMRHTKKYNEAEKQLLKAKELSKDTIPRVHWELALLYGNEMKRYADAAKELTIFLKAQPGTRDAENIKKLIAEFETKALKT